MVQLSGLADSVFRDSRENSRVVYFCGRYSMPCFEPFEGKNPHWRSETRGPALGTAREAQEKKLSRKQNASITFPCVNAVYQIIVDRRRKTRLSKASKRGHAVPCRCGKYSPALQGSSCLRLKKMSPSIREPKFTMRTIIQKLASEEVLRQAWHSRKPSQTAEPVFT